MDVIKQTASLFWKRIRVGKDGVKSFVTFGVAGHSKRPESANLPVRAQKEMWTGDSGRCGVCCSKKPVIDGSRQNLIQSKSKQS